VPTNQSRLSLAREQQPPQEEPVKVVVEQAAGCYGKRRVDHM
jgi:hypothetical protein